MSSSNLLKGFGAGADVFRQLATDKALRRKSTGTFSGFDITDGELLEDLRLTPSNVEEFPHNLRRVPVGAFILKGAEVAVCTAVTASTITIKGSVDTLVTVWVA